MTQADSAPALRMSLDSHPTQGQRQATEITALTPLPDGWGSFCSKPSNVHPSRWYAVAPWHVDTLKLRAPDNVRDLVVKLQQTVDAATWPALHRAVTEQVALHEMLRAEL